VGKFPHSKEEKGEIFTLLFSTYSLSKTALRISGNNGHLTFQTRHA